jgi:lipoate-protein ligase A
MHELIGRSLRTWGISAERVGCGEERKLGSVLCFQHQTVGDLLLAHQKIAGSAQRKSRGAVLQHGGILLSCSRHAPQLNGIVELSGVSISADSLRQALEGQLEGAFGWTLNRENWSACDLEQIRTIESAKYANAAWNLKR